MPKTFWDTCREKKMEISTRTDNAIQTKNWRENDSERKSLKAAANKIYIKSEEADDSK